MEAAAEHSKALKKHTSSVSHLLMHVSDSMLRKLSIVSFFCFLFLYRCFHLVTFLCYAGHWYAVLQSLDQ